MQHHAVRVILHRRITQTREVGGTGQLELRPVHLLGCFKLLAVGLALGLYALLHASGNLGHRQRSTDGLHLSVLVEGHLGTMTDGGQLFLVQDAIETGILVALLTKGHLPLTYQAFLARECLLLCFRRHGVNQRGTLILVHVVHIHTVLTECIQQEGILRNLLQGDVVHVTTVDVRRLLMEGGIIHMHGIG